MCIRDRGYNITIQKFDPYINIDPGTLNPYEHGECYVTVDGMETDLDLGHYERFTGIQTTKANSMTTGRIYKSVIDKERRGDYLGKTIQVVPHITDEIKRNIKQLGQKYHYDFVITEIGGTIGDIESAPFMEAIRQMKWELGDRAINVHLTYVPYLHAAGELKTKPTQHSVKELQSVGIQPDVLVLRTEKHLDEGIRKKVANFCNVDFDCVVQSEDLPSIYEVPVAMQNQGLDEAILRKCHEPIGERPALGPWKSFLDRRAKATEEVHIGLVGKYDLQDAYKSIREALLQAGTYNDRKTVLTFINSEEITEENVGEMLKGQDGIVVCPGFGQRGIEGKVIAAHYSRTHDIPTFGICLGMQLIFDKGYEFEETDGLRLIGGKVEKIDRKDMIIPHMGWNELEINRDCPILKGLPEHPYVYFVHSYAAVCDEANVSAYCDYGGKITALVHDGAYVYGAQFHPEKSGEVGLQMLRNFAELA